MLKRKPTPGYILVNESSWYVPPPPMSPRIAAFLAEFERHWRKQLARWDEEQRPKHEGE